MRSSHGRPTLPDEWLTSLRKALADKGWKARDLAQAIHQTDSSISKLLSNEGKVGLPTIRKVQHVLGLPDPFPKPGPVIARGTRDPDVSTGGIAHELADWIRIGKRIKEHDERKFLMFMEALNEWLSKIDEAEAQAHRSLSVLTGKYTDGERGESKPTDRRLP